MSAIRVLLVDDHPMMRSGLKLLLAALPDVEVVGEAEDGHAAVRKAADLSPDVVVMDFSMPGLTGVDATRAIVDRNRDVKVVILSARSDQWLWRSVLDAGAVGYVPKEEAFGELPAAVRSAAAGKIYLSPKMSSDLTLPTPGTAEGSHAI